MFPITSTLYTFRVALNVRTMVATVLPARAGVAAFSTTTWVRRGPPSGFVNTRLTSQQPRRVYHHNAVVSAPKRGLSRAPWEDDSDNLHMYTCAAYHTSQAYDFPGLLKCLGDRYGRHVHMYSDDAVYVPSDLEENAGTFFFKDGAFVTWGTPVEEHLKYREIVGPFEKSPHFQYEYEEMRYHYGIDRDSGMDADTIVLGVVDDDKSKALEKLAFSYAICRSVRLGVVERRMDDLVSSLKSVPNNLISGTDLLDTTSAQTLRPPRLTLKSVNVKLGLLLELRGYLNLHSDLIDTPDFYWEEPHLETLFTAISETLDMKERIEILNKKLDYSQELVEVLRTHLSEEHGIRLEWAIIGLITVEVLFEFIHYADKYYGIHPGL
eukprot:GFYU01007566.1.p1 GENE.GFYU01007566.1~~GFYU01007566.1.p1  ORF type:complete len:380 (+),score=111.19 GFYU01007566.1:141-1280(+)